MTNKPTTTRSPHKKQRSADRLALSTTQNGVELREDDLTTVAGGTGPATVQMAALWGEGKHVKISF